MQCRLEGNQCFAGSNVVRKSRNYKEVFDVEIGRCYPLRQD